MNLRKVFKFEGQMTVGTGSDEFRAKKGNSFLPEATNFEEPTDGHSGLEAGATAPVWNVVPTAFRGLASESGLVTTLHR